MAAARKRKKRSGSESTAAAQASSRAAARPPGLPFEGKLNAWVVLLVMALLSLIYTLPVAFSPGSRILGSFQGYYGDVFAAIWELWITKRS
ncbi:MAG: hypothetical protein U9P14_11520, partial [Gemmatimonadota bacterium]|nr:hypothetical protein [Gemmatimonadota bacterium]